MMDLQEIKGLSAYELASIAECGCPNTLESAGAPFLSHARNAVVEAWEIGRFDCEDEHDVINELADDVPSVYTYTAWRQFIDLAAWKEEPEAGEWPKILDNAAMMALYQIAERLMFALLADLRESAEDDDDDPELADVQISDLENEFGEAEVNAAIATYCGRRGERATFADVDSGYPYLTLTANAAAYVRERISTMSDLV